MSDFDHSDIAYVPTTGVRRYVETPIVEASDESLKGYGCIVDRPQEFPIEIVRWPAQGRVGAGEGVLAVEGGAEPIGSSRRLHEARSVPWRLVIRSRREASRRFVTLAVGEEQP